MYNRYLLMRQGGGEERGERSAPRRVRQPETRESPAGTTAGLKGILN